MAASCWGPNLGLAQACWSPRTSQQCPAADPPTRPLRHCQRSRLLCQRVLLPGAQPRGAPAGRAAAGGVAAQAGRREGSRAAPPRSAGGDAWGRASAGVRAGRRACAVTGGKPAVECVGDSCGGHSWSSKEDEAQPGKHAYAELEGQGGARQGELQRKLTRGAGQARGGADSRAVRLGGSGRHAGGLVACACVGCRSGRGSW